MKSKEIDHAKSFFVVLFKEKPCLGTGLESVESMLPGRLAPFLRTGVDQVSAPELPRPLSLPSTDSLGELPLLRGTIKSP